MIETQSTQPVSALAGAWESVPGAVADSADQSARTARFGAALRALLRSPSAVAGLLIVLFWVLCAVFWPLLVRYDPNAQDYTAILARPSAAHLLGTDQYGRDVWTRVLAGSREVLILAPAATLIGLGGGLVVGLLTSYFGIQPPSPDWGAMINDAHVYITTAPWIVLAPTLAIASLVVGINVLADGLRRAQRA